MYLATLLNHEETRVEEMDTILVNEVEEPLFDQVLKIMLKTHSVWILISLASYRRAHHSESNSSNDIQIRAHIQKLEQMKVQVWLGHVARLDDMAKVPTNGEAPSGRFLLGPAYCITGKA